MLLLLLIVIIRRHVLLANSTSWETVQLNLFRVCRGQKAKTLESSAYDSKSGNPFSDRPPTSRRNKEAQIALDAAVAELDSNAPENFDASTWDRLCSYRRAKIEMEMNVSYIVHCLPFML